MERERSFQFNDRTLNADNNKTKLTHSASQDSAFNEAITGPCRNLVPVPEYDLFRKIIVLQIMTLKEFFRWFVW